MLGRLSPDVVLLKLLDLREGGRCRREADRDGGGMQKGG